MDVLHFSSKQKRFGDFDIIQADGKLHCIFIESSKLKKEVVGETGNNYGLASSDDGIFWEYKGTVMKPGGIKKTKWNNGSLWAMNVFKKDDKFFLTYSATENVKGDPYQTQQIGLACSKDLKLWTDCQNKPVIANRQTGKHYYPKTVHKFCWRDPCVYKINDTYYCIFAAKDINKAYELSGCVALFKSSNLKNWEALPPLFSPGRYWEIETPHLYKIRNKWYLIFGEYVKGISMSFAVSSTLLGDYKEPSLNTFTPAQCYAGRMIKIKEKYYFYHWIMGKAGKNEMYLSPPKVIEVKNEHLFLKKHESLDKYFENISDNNILFKIKNLKNRRGLLKKRLKNLNIEINIEAKNSKYSRNVFITKTKSGISIRDFDINNQVNDLRTLPIKLGNDLALEIFIEDKFMEVYLNNYFLYATIMEFNFKKIKKIVIKSHLSPHTKRGT